MHSIVWKWYSRCCPELDPRGRSRRMCGTIQVGDRRSNQRGVQDTTTIVIGIAYIPSTDWDTGGGRNFPRDGHWAVGAGENHPCLFLRMGQCNGQCRTRVVQNSCERLRNAVHDCMVDKNTRNMHREKWYVLESLGKEWGQSGGWIRDARPCAAI